MVMSRSSINPRAATRKTLASSSNPIGLPVDLPTSGFVRHYASRSELLQQGTPADDVYFIHDGMVKLVWSESTGKQAILGLRWRGCVIGVPAVVTGQPCPMSVVTLVPSVLERITAEKFLYRLQTDPDFAWKIHQIQSLEVHEQLNWLGEMACCSARSRLRTVFRRLTELCNVHTDGKKARVRLPLRQKEVAELIAVTPEHLSRLLRELSQDGLLHLRQGWIVIQNPQALAEI
jgi:CRP/FNR family transcriptional regulator, cyclic AMP receptor protein